jgi:MFS family permease
VLLPVYLVRLGLDAVQVGAIATATLLGSAGLTLIVGLFAHRLATRSLLLCACALMLATGLGFYSVHELLPLLVVAVLGTLNPTAGDVSVFLPLEQSLMASEAHARDLAAVYARSNLAASASSALGALASASPALLAERLGLELLDAMRLAFVAYGVAAILAALLYAGLRRARPRGEIARAPLARSREIVLKLALLFSLDSFAGGFVVQSLLALWLLSRFGFTLADAASFFFFATLLSGAGQLASPILARRIGLVQTMVYTHLPANLFLLVAAFMPTATLAVTFLLLRTSLSSMDIPVRQAFVMQAVPPEERAAAASVTNVPRSLGTGLAPLLSGLLLASGHLGLPLVLAGSLKIAYDLLLLRAYGRHTASRAAQ